MSNEDSSHVLEARGTAVCFAPETEFHFSILLAAFFNFCLEPLKLSHWKVSSVATTNTRYYLVYSILTQSSTGIIFFTGKTVNIVVVVQIKFV